MIGLNCIVYLAYSSLSGNLSLAMAIDVWALPFLGLGISLLRTKTTKNLINPSRLENAASPRSAQKKDA